MNSDKIIFYASSKAGMLAPSDPRTLRLCERLVAEGYLRREEKTVTIPAIVDVDDNKARELAMVLSDTAPLLASLHKQLVQREQEIAVLKMQVPPKQPLRLLGPGCVRMRDGVVWLLGHRTKGWAAWGIRLDGWDDLFRRYNVIVTEHGTGAHGDYWTVTNAPEVR